jgi:hypothetical protein
MDNSVHFWRVVKGMVFHTQLASTSTKPITNHIVGTLNETHKVLFTLTQFSIILQKGAAHYLGKKSEQLPEIPSARWKLLSRSWIEVVQLDYPIAGGRQR